MFAPRTILVPTDFSEHARAAAHLASALAAQYRAKVLLLHVDPPPLVHGEAVDRRQPDYQNHLRRLIDGIDLPDRGVVVERIISEGAPPDIILDLARDRKCELIVMGTHGRAGLMRAVLGSVAEQIIRTAPCPVLTVRFPQAGGP